MKLRSSVVFSDRELPVISRQFAPKFDSFMFKGRQRMKHFMFSFSFVSDIFNINFNYNFIKNFIKIFITK